MRRLSSILALSALMLGQTYACSLGDIVTKGSTSRSVALDIIDSTDGTPETGVVFNTAGIDLWYRREGAAVTSITEATLAALTTAYSSGGFLAIANGSYRLDVPDAAFATGANYVDIGGTVTGMIVICQRVRLVDYSLEDSVRMGLTALPNATPGAAGGVQIAGSNAATTFASMTVTGTTTLSDGLVVARSTANQPAATFTGNGTGNGVTITSGSGATGTGLAVVAASTNGTAITAAGTGTGNGITSTGGATGHGLSVVGGSTSGSGLRAVATTSGNGILATGVGTTQAGIAATGGSTSSAGISATGGGTGAGILATAGATGIGVSAVGGSTSGAGLSATATSGNGITATGGGTGHGLAATSGSGATGNGITALAASTNGNGMAATGTGTGAGEIDTGGATGSGLLLVGGSTSGNPLATTVTTPVGAVPGFGIEDSGQLQSATSTTAVLRAGVSLADATGFSLEIYAGTGAGQTKPCTAWNNTSKTCTVSTWTTTPDSTSKYWLWGTGAGSGGGGGLDAAATRAALGMSSANLDTQLAALQADTDNLQTRVPTSLVSGRMDASVGAYQTGLTPLQPTTSGRTLDVTATGEAGIDWANIGSPTTTVNLSGTTISTTQAVASVSGAVGSVTGSVGSVTGAVGSVTGNVGGNVTGSVGSVTGAVGSVTGNVGGNVTGSVGSVAAGGITAASLAADSITAAKVASDVSTEINASVLSAISALPNSIRDIQVEDMGGGVTSACVQAVLLSFAAGDIVTTGGSTVWKDPSNGETRITSTVTSNGNRTASITCPTLP